MAAAPTLRVDGRTLEVIQDGQVLTRYSLGDTDVRVRIDDGAVELTADGELLDRYPVERETPQRDEGMTRIPVRASESPDHANVMFY